MPVFPATGCLGYFGGLARICVIDLYAGVSTAPVEMLVDFNQMDFPKLQFLPVGVKVLPSTSVTLTSADSRERGCPGNGHSPGDSFMTNLGFPRASCTPGEIFAGRELRGRTGLYKAGFTDRIASVCVDCDWVTPLRISPQTCTGLFLFSIALCFRCAVSVLVCDHVTLSSAV